MVTRKINTQYVSPNCSDRGNVKVDTIILHGTAGSLEGALTWLCNPRSKVSAHYVVSRAGAIYKLVPLTKAAWHAGFCPAFPFANKRSVGIECEQHVNEALTEEQLSAVEYLIHQCEKQFERKLALAGHKELNPRKSDPFLTDMNALRKRWNLSPVILHKLHT